MDIAIHEPHNWVALQPGHHQVAGKITDVWPIGGNPNSMRGLIFSALDCTLKTKTADILSEWLEEEPNSRIMADNLYEDIQDRFYRIRDMSDPRD